MKIKNIDAINYMTILDVYSNKYLPQKISYAITRNVKVLKNHIDVYSELLNSLLNRYSDYFVKNDNNENVMMPIGIPKVSDAYADEYMNEVNELLNIDIDIDLYTIDDSVFDYENDKYDPLSAKDILNLQNVLCANQEQERD